MLTIKDAAFVSDYAFALARVNSTCFIRAAMNNERPVLADEIQFALSQILGPFVHPYPRSTGVD